MHKKQFVLIAFLLVFGRAFAATNEIASTAVAPPLASSTQMLLVTTKGWDAVPGFMRRFIREDAQSPWKQAGPEIPVVVGRSGLGWGRGLNPPAELPGPIKKEGDRKSPAGIFRLRSVFGLAAADEVKWIKMPYRQLTDGIECVDDVQSAHYNAVVDRGHIAHPDWNSSEKMSQVGQYRLGVVVDHNTAPIEAGAGSCVFIHIWLNEHTGTTGCTAMASKNIEKLLSWLNPTANPVLVQLPESEYKTLQAKWQLPAP
jgi:D-alanyl-D-alanine dipeptidase